MDTIECITKRKSIRAFKPEPVPKALLEEIISIAKRSPSYKNSQPWEMVIVSGEKKQALSDMLLGLLKDDEKPTAEFVEPVSWPDQQQKNINHLYEMRSAATGLDLTDPAIIKKSKKANFNFYFAPHAVYFLQDASLSEWSILDIGMFIQNFMLVAAAKGLGTVPQAYATDYAQQVKSFLNIPETKRLIVGMSIGYPDMDAPANQLKTDRVANNEIVTWLE